MSIYCTYLTVYLGSKLPMFYIGSSSVEKVNKGYHGSVTSNMYKIIWLSEIKENPHLFKTKILTKHKTRDAAFKRESAFQKQFNVHKNPMFINMAIVNHNGTFIGFGPSGAANGMYGKTTSEKQKQSARDRRGYKKTLESIEKYKNTAKKLGLNKGIKNPRFGKTNSTESNERTAANQRGENCKYTRSTWVNDGKISKRIVENELIQDGWRFGRIYTKIWITNEIINLQHDKLCAIPVGWRQGMMKRAK